MRTLISLAPLALLALVRGQQPEMAHIALTGKAGQISVDFASHPRDGTPPSSYGCLIGTSPDNWNNQMQFVTAYNMTNFTSQDAAFGDQTFLHQVLFTGLQSGTTYYYVCGSEATKDPWSQVYSFNFESHLSRPGGARYAVLADAGYYNFESLGDLMAAAEEGSFDVLIHSGDMAYNLEDEKGAIGDGFMRQMEPIASKIPYMGG